MDVMNLVLNDISANVVSIKAGNIYPLTYSTLANVSNVNYENNDNNLLSINFTVNQLKNIRYGYFQMLSLTVTYFIICIQR